MIGSVSISAGGTQHTLRLTTRAQLKLEAQYDKAISLILADLGEHVRTSFLVDFFKYTMNSGAGASEDDALDMIDELGGMQKAAALLADVLKAAFPDASKGAQDAGAEAAGKKKAPRAA